MKIRIFLAIFLTILSVNADLLGTGLGMVTSVSSPEAQEKLMNDGVIPFLFDMITSTSIKEFPIKNGKFTNIVIKVIPPPSFDDVQTEVLGDAMFVKVGGIGVKIGADFEIYYENRPATGHVDVDITDLGVHVKLSNAPQQRQGDRKVGVEVTMDLSKTHANAKFTTEGNVQEIREHLFNMVKDQAAKGVTDTVSSWVPEWASNFGWKIGRIYQPINYMFEKRTEDILNQFANTIPNLDQSKIAFRPSQGVSYKMSAPRNNLVDYGVSSASEARVGSEFIKKSLNSNGYMFNRQGGKLDLDKQFHDKLQHSQHMIQDDKMHYLISPELIHHAISKVGKDSKTDLDVISNLLHKDLNKKVDDYFGSKVKFTCTPSSSEPKLVGKDDAIVGTYTMVCSLGPEDGSEEPYYQMEMDLEFTIHPELDADGKSLKANFGSIQSTDMSYTNKGNTKITAKVSDKQQMNFLFPGFGGIFGNLDQDDATEYEKFIESLNFSNDDDTLQQIFSNEILFPFPVGFGFVNPQFQINENGVVDVSGDVGFDKEEAKKTIK